jgi:pyruvate dehydrogenase E2 component (dihydrolipoamide acetyltransferase)
VATDITMPRLSDSMEEGTIIKWLVSEGDEVQKGQEIAEIETDKANMTYESDTAGTVIELVASEGDTLELGAVIARIGEPGEKSAERSAQSAEGRQRTEDRQEEPEPEPEPETAPSSPSSNGGDGDGRVKASPVARRMAEERGVELGSIEGSGPGGRIVKADVVAAAEGGGTKTKEAPPVEEDGKPEREPEPQPEPAGEAGPKGETQVQELTRMQRTVSRRMAESKATAPDFQLTMEVDMSLCVELRERLKKVSDPAPSFNDMVVKAVANALREFPRVNGAYRDGKFELYSRINVGVAVAAHDALVVPTIFDADKKSLGEIARQARALIEKVRDAKITPPELGGGTFTVSNLGMYGIDEFTAVINPPQAAILAVGSLKKRPVVDDGGRIVVRDTMNVTLVCDHRILYGADGAEFLARVRELLEQPLALAL